MYYILYTTPNKNMSMSMSKCSAQGGRALGTKCSAQGGRALGTKCSAQGGRACFRNFLKIVSGTEFFRFEKSASRAFRFYDIHQNESLLKRLLS